VNAAKSSTATATTATAETAAGGRPTGYVGRFAPSPTGDLHLGSLYTAAGSFLDARAHGGEWRLRIEDIDTPRVVPGAADGILRTLQRFGLEWDGPVVRQSERSEHYESAILTLRELKATFGCSCSRSQLAADERYPGYCRDGALEPDAPLGLRLRVDPGAVIFTDRIQGRFRQDVAATVGDLLLRRRDGLFAYLLAVVVDDAAQHITHVVRGADLLDNTPRQMLLQRLLGFGPPAYAHLPVLVEANGDKLAKARRSVPVAAQELMPTLMHVFRLLELEPPRELEDGSLSEAWRWAVHHWRIERIPRRLTLSADGHQAV
jgi:glutamyl-Q tRNA(Asp) synthetase